MRNLLFLCAFLLVAPFSATAQNTDARIAYPPDSLQQQVADLHLRLNHVQDNLGKASNKMKYGILVASIGYSVTIAGGQLLGGKNGELGEALLYTGGGIGLAGTVLLFDAFRFMKKASKRPKSKKLY